MGLGVEADINQGFYIWKMGQWELIGAVSDANAVRGVLFIADSYHVVFNCGMEIELCECSTAAAVSAVLLLLCECSAAAVSAAAAVCVQLLCECSAAAV